MVGLSFAAVPLYRIFCQATGYDGTTQARRAASSKIVDREITVRFDASMSSALDWKFQPAQREMRLKIGENGLAFFTAENMSAKPLTGTATFNITPEIAASYFNKIAVFLLYRAASGGRAKGRYAGFLLHRSCHRRRSRRQGHQRNYPFLHLLQS